MLVGLGLIIASGCVVNNYIDRDIDKHMKRTAKRSLVTGDISVTNALIFATILGISGTLILAYFVNSLSAYTALAGFILYVLVYTPLKRITSLSTLIGSFSGAIPPVVGYVAVSDRYDAAVLLLFLIVAVWQMPHFYAIGIFRRTEYAAAKLPILSVVNSIKTVRLQISLYIALFILASSLLYFYGFTSQWYLGAMLIISTFWFVYSVKKIKNTEKWAKNIFVLSLLTLLIFCISLSLDSSFIHLSSFCY
jgi:protoheme IX farnesyltransferase